MTYDIVIIGGGAAGIASAAGSYEKGLKVLLIERSNELGGILNQCIHNGFGLHMYQEELTGPEYARKSEKSLNEDIVVKLSTSVISIKKEQYFIIEMTSKVEGIKTIYAKSVIISSGSYERTRGQINLPGKRIKGIMTAGSAQRYLNKEGFLVGNRILILGSGDIGLIMARRMTLEGAKVLAVVELMSNSNGLTRNIVSCLEDFNIPLYLSHTVTNVIGKNFVEAVDIMQVDEKFTPIEGTAKRFQVDTLLLSVGLIPEVSLIDNLGVMIDKVTKSAVVNQSYQSNIDGLFFCGNALHIHDVVDWVSKEALNAGVYAKTYVKGKLVKNRDEQPILTNEYIKTTVPQVIDFNNMNNDFDVSFRSTIKSNRANIRIVQDGMTIKEKKINYINPAEMEKITIEIDKLISKNAITLMLEVIS